MRFERSPIVKSAQWLWQQRWPVVLGGTIVAAILGGRWIFLQVDGYISPQNSSERKDVIDMTTRIFAGASVLTGAFFAWQQIYISREGQYTDRFTKAIDQLGSEKLEIRLGGIYSLERIAGDSEKDYLTIIETLSAFIRENSPVQRQERNQSLVDSFLSSQEKANANKKVESLKVYMAGALMSDQGINFLSVQDQYLAADLPEKVKALKTDTQAALTAIIRLLGREEIARGVDFRKVDLRGASFYKANLRNSNFSNADLRGADFSGANLKGANFMKADLYETNFRSADLRKAILFGLHLKKTSFARADLRKADLRLTKLGSMLFGADLRESDLSQSLLQRTNLTGLDLRGANLTGADLEDVIYDVKTNWEGVIGLETAKNIPEALRQKLGIEEETQGQKIPELPFDKNKD